MAPREGTTGGRFVGRQQENPIASHAQSDSAEPATSALAFQGDGPFAHLAQKLWQKLPRRPTKVKVKPDILKKDIWDVLETADFSYDLLFALENLQILENYLWPGYSDESSNYHVLLIVLMTNVRRREQLPVWNLYDDNPEAFSSLFRRVLSMTIDTTFSPRTRQFVLTFVICAFQSLDRGIVRKECAPLVSISIWHNLSTDEKREKYLDKALQLRKAWRAAAKRYDAATDVVKSRLRFERSWLYTLIFDFFTRIYDLKSGPEDSLYCERFIEFLSDLQSQLPTRRYVNSLLRDLHVLQAIEFSPLFSNADSSLLRDLFSLLKHYTDFPVDDNTGNQYSETEAYDHHSENLAILQRISLRYCKDELTLLALSNYGSIEKREDLAGHLQSLSEENLVRLCKLLHLRTSYPVSTANFIDQKFLLQILISNFEKRKSFQDVACSLNVLPTELSLFESILLRTETYDGSRPLGLPKLNLQYLSVGDFLWRSLVLYRCESFTAIRKDIEYALQRLRPRIGRDGNVRFEGSSRMALPISKPAILEVVPPHVGHDNPSSVRAEISLDFRHVVESVRRDWESLRADDVIFLLGIQPNGENSLDSSIPNISDSQGLRLKYVRAAEITHTFDQNGQVAKPHDGENNDKDGRRTRRLHVKLDARAYNVDVEKSFTGQTDVYDSINVIVRRRGRENNFKPILESIQGLISADVPLPTWLREVFLGYGDPAGASYAQLPNHIKKMDFRDTFLDWQHLIQSLPGQVVEPSDEMEGSFSPPYILETNNAPSVPMAANPSKKRRRGETEPVHDDTSSSVRVSTYTPVNTGPYPVDKPKLNAIRFTPAQIEAIISGSRPGLTIVIGPPGTGKTNVATQIINNIYHNFPNERTLLIAHSNQALNQLFQKIVALDIDERHLLRLGHGEEDLDTQGSFGKYGRVESFLENRDRYLLEINRLAAELGAPGAHGDSAETAGYFNEVYVKPAWARYQEIVRGVNVSAEDIIQAFPFHNYFSNAPQPLFPPSFDTSKMLDVADGCYNHIVKIFTELSDVRPFEILRRDRDKANYLLTNEARIIAMTSTHAAMRRREIVSLGFHYDNVVVEEAAQITEIENFIPFALQRPINGSTPLHRVVLCGDHFQNSPIVQNLAFRQYANLEQSLFSRLVRLGVPTTTLDQQGRSRQSIAELYQWRYSNLSSLPHVKHGREFQTANAGFKYDYQFIDVPNYKGKGETAPAPHVIHNLGEAEYAVAIYQYMRLLGYPASNITILATYAGQRALIKEILQHRCVRNPLFGEPKAVATVDKYQGEQNDYVILSLTRTSRVGFLRDVKRFTVALSRARLGLYILGRRELFESCFELRPAFEILLRRTDKLSLVTSEMFPSTRIVDAEGGREIAGETVMENVEHLGQYVYEMTNARVQQFREENDFHDGTSLIEHDDGEIARYGENDFGEDQQTKEGRDLD